MCRCLDVSHSGLLHLGVAGVCRKPAKRRRETRHFCDVFLQRLQTNPPVIDGPTKSWNVGGVTTSPETVRRLMQQEGLVACQPRPKARTTAPAADLAGRPDLIERNFTAGAPAQKLVGEHHSYASHPGRIRVPGDRDGLLLEKNCWLRHSRDTCEPNWSKKLCKIGGSELPAHQGCDDFSCRV